MKLKAIVDEDFTNYRLPSLFLATCYCNWKCCTEANIPITICQNNPISQQPNIEVSADEIFRRYQNNPITKAVVFGGLEPFLQFNEMLEIVKYFREHNCEDPIIAYTGYYPEEISDQVNQLKQFKNLIIKYGRYKPDQQSHFDKVLGVHLASDTQYAVKIS